MPTCEQSCVRVRVLKSGDRATNMCGTSQLISLHPVGRIAVHVFDAAEPPSLPLYYNILTHTHTCMDYVGMCVFLCLFRDSGTLLGVQEQQ